MNEVIKQVTDAIRPTIASAVARAVNSSVGLDIGDASKIADDVSKEVAKAVVNQANLEPWYASTVTIGASITLITGSYALGYDFLDGTIPTPTEFATSAAPVIGSLITIWGRWFQKKPIGA